MEPELQSESACVKRYKNLQWEVHVFGCPWGGKTLAREGCLQLFWGCKCMALNVGMYRAGYGFHAGLCRMGPETQLTPETRASHLWEMHTGWPSGPEGCCPLSLPDPVLLDLVSCFGARREAGRGGDGSREMKWGTKAAPRVFYQVHLRFSSAYHITQTALEEPSIYPLP